MEENLAESFKTLKKEMRLTGLFNFGLLTVMVILFLPTVMFKPSGSGDIGELVQAEIRKNPELIAQTLNDFYGKKKLEAAAAEKQQMDKLEPALFGDASQPFVGAKTPAVDIVYFFDVNCPHCRRMSQVFQRVLGERKDIRIVYREIPILGPDSVYAARLASAVWLTHPEDYARVSEAFKASPQKLDQADADATLLAVVGQAKADEAKEALQTRADVAKLVDGNLAVSNAAGITGTPFIKIRGGQTFKGAIDYETLMKAIAAVEKKS